MKREKNGNRRWSLSSLAFFFFPLFDVIHENTDQMEKCGMSPFKVPPSSSSSSSSQQQISDVTSSEPQTCRDPNRCFCKAKVFLTSLREEKQYSHQSFSFSFLKILTYLAERLKKRKKKKSASILVSDRDPSDTQLSNNTSCGDFFFSLLIHSDPFSLNIHN